MQQFYKNEARVTNAQVPFTLKEFKDKIFSQQPKEIFHSYWSNEKPIYVINKYSEFEIEYYSNAWDGKTPHTIGYEKFFKELRIQDLTLFYYFERKLTEPQP